MNAAIQDAANLGCKLAFAAARFGDAPLLDSYNRERRPVIASWSYPLILAFWAEAGPAGTATSIRGSGSLAGVAGLPAVARGSAIEGGRDPFPPTRDGR